MPRAIIWTAMILVLGAIVFAGVYLWHNSRGARDDAAGGNGPSDDRPGDKPAPAVTTGMPPAIVHVARVVQQDVAHKFQVMGTILPARRSIVSVGSAGRVTDFLVQEGDYVAAEMPLLVQRTRDLEIERAMVLANLQHRWHDWMELLTGFRQEDIDQAEARYALALVQERFAHQRLERTEKSGAAVSLETVDEVKASYEMAARNVDQARAFRDLMRSGPREEVIARAAAAFAAAVADLQRVDEEIWKKTLRAPFDGYIAAKYAELGQFMHQGEAGVEVIELKKLEIEVKVPERYLVKVKVGQPVAVEIETLDAVGDKALTGTVLRIIPHVDPQTRTLPVRIGLDNVIDEASPHKTPWIKAGLAARVGFNVGTEETLLVPKDALVFAAGREPSVYVVVERPAEGDRPASITSRPVAVRVGQPRDALIEVAGPLQAGQKVVTRGNERLMPGQPLLIAIDE